MNKLVDNYQKALYEELKDTHYVYHVKDRAVSQSFISMLLEDKENKIHENIIFEKKNNISVIQLKKELEEEYTTILIENIKQYEQLCGSIIPQIRNNMFTDTYNYYQKSSINFFAKYYNNNPNLQDDLLLNYNMLINQPMEMFYRKLFPLIYLNKTLLLEKANQLTSEIFNLYDGEIENDDISPLSAFCNFVKEYKLTKEESAYFWLQFFENKKIELTEIKYGTDAKNIILELFSQDDEIINKFVKIMPILKKALTPRTIEDQISVFDREYLYMLEFSINTKTMEEMFYKDRFNQLTYNMEIYNFIEYFCNYYNVTKYQTITNGEEDNYIHFMAVHNKKEIDKLFFQERCIDFFNEFKHLSETVVTEDRVQKWLLQYDIRRLLPIKENNNSLSMVRKI